MADKFLALPILERFPAATTWRRPTVPYLDRSIDPIYYGRYLARQRKGKRFLRQFFFFMSRVRAPDGYLTPLISCLSEKICCIVYNNLGRTNAQFWIGLLCLVDHFYFIFHSCFEIKISLTG
jgi:hypothetical protein